MQNILITGGSKGIGFETVKLLCDKYKFYVISRNKDLLTTINNENIEHIEFDLSKKENYHLLDEILQDKQIDILINNIGGGPHSKVQNITIEKAEESINLNLFANIYITSIISKQMIKQQKGLIINMSSIHGLTGNPNSSLYSAGKFALKGFCESLFFELKKHNIKVTTIYPDVTNTDLIPKSVLNRDKMIQPEHIANVIKNIIEMSAYINIKDISLY